MSQASRGDRGRCRMTEGERRSGLCAELAGRAELGDVEIDFQNALLRQHEVDPERERKFERLRITLGPCHRNRFFRDPAG